MNKQVSGLRADEVSPLGVVFTMVSTAARLTTMATALSVAIGFGNGVRLSGGYLVVALSSPGWPSASASRGAHITNAGALYAYIAAGLSRPRRVRPPRCSSPDGRGRPSRHAPMMAL